MKYGLRMPIVGLLVAASSSLAVERISFKRDEQTLHVAGEVVVEAQDGGVMLRTADGELWIIQPEEMLERTRDEARFVPLTAAAMAEQLLGELPQGFRIHQTQHYVICYNTSMAYAEWCGSLLERLHRGFYNFWKNHGWELAASELPLVALVYDSQESFARFTQHELRAATNTIIGYYSVQTNRVNMYDLTGVEGLGRPERGANATRINQILSQPGAERTVATIVHEATHQLAYNSGLQTRFADNPFWVSEGLAVYFESPDLKTTKGWRTIGAVNQYALGQFRQTLAGRQPGRLETLLRDDKPFRDPVQGPLVYGESWALNYFLLRTRSAEYVEYLQRLAKQPPLGEVSADERVAQFQAAFGTDPATLEHEFLRYMKRVR